MERKRMTFRIDERDHLELKHWALRDRQMSPSEVLRKLVRDFNARCRERHPSGDV